MRRRNWRWFDGDPRYFVDEPEHTNLDHINVSCLLRIPFVKLWIHTEQASTPDVWDSVLYRRKISFIEMSHFTNSSDLSSMSARLYF